MTRHISEQRLRMDNIRVVSMADQKSLLDAWADGQPLQAEIQALREQRDRWRRFSNVCGLVAALALAALLWRVLA